MLEARRIRPLKGYGESLLFNAARLVPRWLWLSEAYFDLAKTSEARIAFVIGTGRSGTHFVTECLISNIDMTDFTGGEEDPRVFRRIASAALDPALEGDNLRIARLWYSRLSAEAWPKWFVDQSHPNIWFADFWAAVFPDASFIGILRNPYSVVASMLKHRGTLQWVIDWDRYPLPNRFLGITEQNKDAYGAMSHAERCTVRWLSHYNQLQRLRQTLGDRLHVVEFEALCAEPSRVMSSIVEWLGVRHQFVLPEVDRSSLTKYKALSEADLAGITRILVDADVPPEAYAYPE